MKIYKCDKCGQLMDSREYGYKEKHNFIGAELSVSGPKGVKLLRHKKNRYRICFDCLLDSFGIKE